MRVVVQKFGGSSVKNAEKLLEAARKAVRAKHAGSSVIVVVSAQGSTTDDLIAKAAEITATPSAREMDMLLATGEQISIALTALAIQELGEKAVSFTGPQIGIVTDSTHRKARIKSIDTRRLSEALEAGHIVVVAGFQGIDEQGDISTLGRGGSDTTAVAVAAAAGHLGEGGQPDVREAQIGREHRARDVDALEALLLDEAGRQRVERAGEAQQLAGREALTEEAALLVRRSG